ARRSLAGRLSETGLFVRIESIWPAPRSGPSPATPTSSASVCRDLTRRSRNQTGIDPGSQNPGVRSQTQPAKDSEVRFLLECRRARINKRRNRTSRKYSARKKQDLKP